MHTGAEWIHGFSVAYQIKWLCINVAAEHLLSNEVRLDLYVFRARMENWI
jgi:hypothetical protein